MNGRFINDVIEYKCQDGKLREAMIVKDFNNGKFDVAYITSNGCKNVTVHVEENISANRLLGESVQKKTILPYQIGDLVAYYVEPETYYLAHIIDVGPYNTVKVLLGDLYMNAWVQDDKKGDVLEIDVRNIRWDGHASEADKATKIKYGYEPQELKDSKQKQKIARGIGKTALVCGLWGLVILGGVRIYSYLKEQSNQQAIETVYTPPVIENTRPDDDTMNAYMPIERIFAEIYEKPIEDISDEEKAAITYLKVSEDERITGSEYWYFIDYAIGGGEIESFNYMTTQGIDSYNFPQFCGVTDFTLHMEDLKTLEFLSSMPQVRKFELSNTSVSNIAVLEALSIEELVIYNNDEISDYSVLSRILGLKKLYIDCDIEKLETITEDLTELETLTTDGVKLISKCPNLKSLKLPFFFASSTARDFSIVTSHTSLEELSITNGNIDESAKGLFCMESLKSLTLDECLLRIDPDTIPENNKLTDLSFNNISFITNYYEESSGFISYIDYDKVELVDCMELFNRFPNLKTLCITNQKIDDISVLSDLKELVTLDLSGNFITDFSPLSDLPKLKTVTIKDNPFNVEPSSIKIGNDVEIVY